MRSSLTLPINTLFVFLCILESTTELRDHEDFSMVEESILRYYKHENGQLKWSWSIKPFCRVMCRGPGEKLGVKDEYTYIEQREIMLESLDCTKIEVELLTCYCETRRPPDDDNELDLYTIFVYSFFSGVKGEIYQMYSPPPFIPAKCNDSQTYTIFKTIVRGVAYATDSEYQRPRLRGIERIFEEISYTGFNVEFRAGRTGVRTYRR